jgi:uridine kinase
MNIASLVEAIIQKRSQMPAESSLLVGISGIDASGKGFITSQIVEELKEYRVAVINVDGWLNLPHIRFDPARPAENFYENALRLDEMFERLIVPLRETRNTKVTMDYAEETGTEFSYHCYEFNDIDIILLEGIFIFKRQFVERFDLKIWIDCSFETALTRALARSQEGLSPQEIVNAYRKIYFPAQKLHFNIDHPRDAAEIILNNNRT